MAGAAGNHPGADAINLILFQSTIIECVLLQYHCHSLCEFCHCAIGDAKHLLFSLAVVCQAIAVVNREAIGAADLVFGLVGVFTAYGLAPSLGACLAVCLSNGDHYYHPIFTPMVAAAMWCLFGCGVVEYLMLHGC